MNNQELAERLGFIGGGRVERMFQSVGFSSKKFSDIKKGNRDKKLKEIVVKHFGVTLSELVDALEDYKLKQI